MRGRYGTFEDLSERLIFEMHGDVRLQVKNALLGKRKTAVATVRHRRALLIDEVPGTLAPSPPAPALHLRRAVRFRSMSF